MRVYTGLEKLLEQNSPYKGKKIALLANPASVSGELIHAKKLIFEKFREKLTTLFSPQHGFNAEKQDNMILSDHFTDKDLNIPIFSLYGETLEPKPYMLQETDVLLIDIQDVGTRVYTFIYTISYCLEAAKKAGVKVVILDRPNPVSGEVFEGNILEKEYSSFVGRYPIPMRHGLTCGEFALFINNEFHIDADLEVIRMEGWKRSMYFHYTGLPWILPSPNLPSIESSYVYPGQVIFEGTNLSEARGTTKPFEFFGAPYLNQKNFKNFLGRYDLKGIYLRDIVFEPTSGKWAKIPCKGFQVHIKDINEYSPYLTSLAFLQAAIQTSGQSFKYKEPPYEFEYVKKPIDLIIGSKKIRKLMDDGKDLYKVKKEWNQDLEIYKKRIKDYLLY